MQLKHMQLLYQTYSYILFIYYRCCSMMIWKQSCSQSKGMMVMAKGRKTCHPLSPLCFTQIWKTFLILEHRHEFLFFKYSRNKIKFLKCINIHKKGVQGCFQSLVERLKLLNKIYLQQKSIEVFFLLKITHSETGGNNIWTKLRVR